MGVASLGILFLSLFRFVWCVSRYCCCLLALCSRSKNIILLKITVVLQIKMLINVWLGSNRRWVVGTEQRARCREPVHYVRDVLNLHANKVVNMEANFMSHSLVTLRAFPHIHYVNLMYLDVAVEFVRDFVVFVVNGLSSEFIFFFLFFSFFIFQGEHFLLSFDINSVTAFTF